MKIENQVCTLEQAKRLKELGVNTKCAFGFIEIPANGLGVYAYWHDEKYALINADIIMYLGNGEGKWYAPTVTELGAMFGKGTSAASLLYDAVQDQMNRSHSFTIVLSPQFLANCLIGLLETGRVAADEVNQRLQTA
jgi:hypothetical protein